MDPFLIGGAVAALVAAGYLLWRWLKKRRNGASGQGGAGSGSGNGGVSDDDAYNDQLEREWAAREAAAREAERKRRAAAQKAEIVQLLTGDPELAKLLMEQAGLGDMTPRFAAEDDEAIRKIADRVDPRMRGVLSAANRSTTQMDDIQLKSTTERDAVSYPADQYDIERMTSDAQLADVLPEQLAGDDDLFYASFADGDLSVTQHYEDRTLARRIYILFDASGSMGERMRDGMTRTQWAAGVALRLMLRAVNGQAEYLLRYFTDKLQPVKRVFTPADAQKMATELLRVTDMGGGTDIDHALKRAVKDARSSDNADVETSDILLVTDGQSELDEAWLEATFYPGSDVRLHVASIGQENPLLKAVATTYEVYS
jgi:uncharacterized protein with von Willebrand factor type A (vWA) domain